MSVTGCPPFCGVMRNHAHALIYFDAVRRVGSIRLKSAERRTNLLSIWILGLLSAEIQSYNSWSSSNMKSISALASGKSPRFAADLRDGDGAPAVAPTADNGEPKLCPHPIGLAILPGTVMFAPEPKTTQSQNSIVREPVDVFLIGVTTSALPMMSPPTLNAPPFPSGKRSSGAGTHSARRHRGRHVRRREPPTAS